MTTTQPTKNPYTFSKDAWHCRLFKWCYGVNPPDVFKTMCPYFWSFVGTFFIIPFIALAKAMRVPSKSIGEFVSNRVKDCEAYKQKRKDKKDAKIEAKRLANLNECYLIVKSIMDNPDATNEQLYEAYQFLRKRNISISRVRWYIQDDLQLMNYSDANDYMWQFDVRVIRGKEAVQRAERDKEIQERESKIEKVDNTILTLEKIQESKILKWILMIIAGAAIVCIVGALFYGIYTLFAKVIVPNITFILSAIAIGVAVIALLAGVIFSIYQFFKCWGETIGNGLAWFFKGLLKKLCWLGNGFVYLLGYCKPLLNIFLIFKYIALGFVLIGKTIYAIYKQYCPIITWVETE